MLCNPAALVLAAGLLASTPLLAPAFPAPPAQPGQPVAPAPAAPRGLAVAQEPFRIASIGLAMHLTEGALAQTTQAGDQLSVQITPPPPDSTWIINVQTPASKNTELTAEQVAAEVLDQLLRSVGVIDRRITGANVKETLVSTKGTVVQPVKAYELANAEGSARRPAAHFYVKLPRDEQQPAVIRGYTIFRVAPGRFVSFDLATAEPQFAAAKQAYETMVSSIRFSDPGEVEASRGVSIIAGVDFISKLSPSDYDAAIEATNDQWYRLYKPAPGGSDHDAQEIAYRRIRAWKGMRGEIDPKAVPASLKGSERQIGYLVRIDARFLQGDTTTDSVGVYFMAPDRREEAWNIQMVVRSPDQRTPATFREAGAREGASMNVSVTGTAREDRSWRPVVPETGYITLVENFLLPQLLIQAKASAGERGFYVYQSHSNKISMRRDILAGIADRAGAIQLISRQSEDQEPQTAIYNERGELTHLSKADGTLMVPIALQRLHELWRSKNLPLD